MGNLSSLRNLPELVSSYCYDCQQKVLSVIPELKNYHDNTELFQKIFQVVVACFQIAIIRNSQIASLPKLSFVLSTANMHDFYNFLKLPRLWFTPISVDTINDTQLLESLEDCLVNNLEEAKKKKNAQPVEAKEEVLEEEVGLDEDDDEDEDDNLDAADIPHLRDLATKALGNQLISMAKNGDAYPTAQAFKDTLTKHLNAVIRENGETWLREYSQQKTTLFDIEVDLTNLEIEFRHVPIGERLTNLAWAVVDLACVGMYFKEWNLLDTAKWADRVGQYQGFQWVKDSHADKWFIGALTGAFALKLLEAGRKLLDDTLTKQERLQARWNVVTSLAELNLYGSMYLHMLGRTQFSPVYIQACAIFAKSLGILSIATRIHQQREFFRPRERSVQVAL